jgi:hypothetical protein
MPDCPSGSFRIKWVNYLMRSSLTLPPATSLSNSTFQARRSEVNRHEYAIQLRLLCYPDDQGWPQEPNLQAPQPCHGPERA